MERQSSQTSTCSPLRAMPRLPWAVVVAALAIGGLALAVEQTDEATAQMPPYQMAQVSPMDERAEDILNEMATKLAAADAFTIEGRRTIDPELVAGAEQPERTEIKVAVNRQDMLYGEARGEDDHRKMFYNGEDFTLVDAERGLYSTVSVPGTIDVLLRTLSEEYGFNPPVADLLVADPFAHLVRYVEAGKYIGQEEVDGKTTDHLRFEEEYLRWDIWVDTQEKLPVKTVGTVMNMPDNPQLVAEGLEFDLDAKLDDTMFTFDPSPEANEIEMVPVGEEPTAAK